jgi:hypothetical protein
MKKTILKIQVTPYIIIFAVKEGFGRKNVYDSFSAAKVQKARFYKLSIMGFFKIFASVF